MAGSLEEARGFKGIWIPREIWLSPDLSITEKCLLVEIDSLDASPRHCFKSNEAFAAFLGCSVPTVTRGIKHLEALGFVRTGIVPSEHGTERRVSSLLRSDPPHQNDETPSSKRSDPPHQNDEQVIHPSKSVSKSEMDSPRSNHGKDVFGEFENVLLSDHEYKKLLDGYGQVQLDAIIKKLSTYKAANGKKYKSDFAAIREWVLGAVGAKEKGSSPPAVLPWREQLRETARGIDGVDFSSSLGMHRLAMLETETGGEAIIEKWKGFLAHGGRSLEVFSIQVMEE